MNSTETRPLPNAADKAAFKAIATSVIQTCPGLQDTAHEVAGDLLKKHGITGLDPDQVYFHRFSAAQSSSKTFTGWEHVDDKPTASLTLTQLVIQRFRATDQDNADLLDLYAGFYSVGPDAGTFDESNEVRLHGNEVLKDFWSVDFRSLYHQRLSAFWDSASSDFRTLAKCNFLIFPFIGLAADLWLMVSLDHLAVYLGLSWLAIGVVYLAVLTGGFRRQPEMDFQEAA